MARVVAINISEQKKTPKKSIPEGRLIEAFGFEATRTPANGTVR